MAVDENYGLLPTDCENAVLVGRVWDDAVGGPTPVAIRNSEMVNLSHLAPTMSEILENCSATEILSANGPILGSVRDIEGGAVRVLAPVDLQCIKACGVTFAVSALERVIEERAMGDPGASREIRKELEALIGGELRTVKAGSEAALCLKERLQIDGYWSQYLEVAIGPDAEVFTKAPCLAAVGWGEEVGVRADSNWNNPEPEVVLICDSRANILGATLGNDVNLRDFEGRSALLLGKAKDNNASCAIGPFIRLFDDQFTLDDVRDADVTLEVVGEDGFRLCETVSMREITRDPKDLVAQTCSGDHHYPDGFALFLGTLFAPVQDRDVRGQGFTHHLGDEVQIRSPRLGTLRNRVNHSHLTPPWTFGLAALMRNLANRGLL
ncbi:Fumarylacetoacetate (FAA) hydrolase family protein [Tsuneonella dongtanensis]|uniref:Fumarylacetoacetate (FAA) hydrolase family protein n=1 Tax=Tsuneonella dongtanensis TaxID=692370 RepID=A0A1B2A941_9SPHN|nr:fumarylacetoacetate hydrolase family protein [Tsuneonella dongtanensis]ANY18652.1 Fumarylacetoacetate (FAA) hydrolase family protein [Tsuneonella dongtanensis]